MPLVAKAGVSSSKSDMGRSETVRGFRRPGLPLRLPCFLATCSMPARTLDPPPKFGQPRPGLLNGCRVLDDWLGVPVCPRGKFRDPTANERAVRVVILRLLRRIVDPERINTSGAGLYLTLAPMNARLIVYEEPGQMEASPAPVQPKMVDGKRHEHGAHSKVDPSGFGEATHASIGLAVDAVALGLHAEAEGGVGDDAEGFGLVDCVEQQCHCGHPTFAPLASAIEDDATAGAGEEFALLVVS